MTTALQRIELSLPMGNLNAYLQGIKEVPVLSAEQERALALRLRDHNDLDAARELILSQLRFVAYIARGYDGYGLAQADLIQEGNIGLMKAVKRFDPEFGVRLISFAVHWIKAEIHEFVLRNWRVVRVATTKAQRKLFFQLRSSKKRLGWLNADEVEAVAQDLGVPARTVVEMEQRLSARDASFDGLPGDDDDNRPPAPSAYLQDQRPDPATAIENQDWQAHQQAALATALQGLNERNRDILTQRWLNPEKATLHQLAERHGVSAERIRQLEQNALKQLRTTLAA